MSTSGPLQGLRVIDLTDDLGRFASKLLAEYGADVRRPVGSGSRGREMSGRRATRFGGSLDWWFDAAKSPIDLDLDSDEGVERYRRLAGGADIVIEAKPVGYLAERGIDHEHLTVNSPRLTQVSLTPFGRTGPWASWHSSDLVAGALGGVLSITGTPDAPLNSWGWQNYNFGGFSAALCGLAGVRSARMHGRGRLVDLSLHEVIVGSMENLLMQYLYDDLLPLPKVAKRQGSLHWLGAYQVVPARSGHVMITPTPQPGPLIEWMIASGIPEAEPFIDRPVEELLADMPQLMAAIRTFVATKDADELFVAAQDRHIAFGEVQTVRQVADNPQFAHRGLYDGIGLGEGQEVRAPWRLVRFSDTPIATPNAPPLDPVDAVWPDRGDEAVPSARGTDELPKPLEGVVVLDLSWVLAGPFATRLLGDLGADVIKVQTEERASLVNQPDFPYYPVWNRSKRSVTLNLKHPEALGMVRRLVERADILVENYSSGVLSRLGMGWDAVQEWNDQLVYISMSGCGHDGPWKDIISYAPTIHALCGLTYLTNPVDRGDVGCGFSLNDHAAGFGAAWSVLAAVEARRRTGRGQYIDMAQLEVGAYLVGPALLDLFNNNREARSAGNVDGLADIVPNEVYPCADGRYLAVSATDDAMWARLAALLTLDDPELALLEARRAHRSQIDLAVGSWCRDRATPEAMQRLQAEGIAAGVVQNAEDLVEHDEQLRARQFWLEAEHETFGTRRHDRFPGLWANSSLEPYLPAPAYLGEANFDVWTDLAGLDAAEVAEGIANDLFI